MPITVWSYLQEYAKEKEEVHAAIDRVLTSGRLILGECVKEFEQGFAEYCGAEFGVGVANGTDAIFLALKAVGVGPGDEVITVANTAVPTVSAIVATGAEPRFVDIDPHTYLLDTARLAQAITPKTACIIPVHLYGQCVGMDLVDAVAGEHGLQVVEDCAQSHGAAIEGRVAGSLGHAAAFSFYPTKLLGGYGDGGMVVTSSSALRDKLKRLRFYGMDNRYFAEEDGYNSRLDELHAAILAAKLKHLDTYIARRRQLAARYDEALADTSFALPVTADGNQHAYYLYVCRHPRRDEVIAELKKRDILVNISYPWPIHHMPPYRQFAVGQELPHTEKAAQEIFSLPMYPTLSDEEQDQVVDALRQISDELA